MCILLVFSNIGKVYYEIYKLRMMPEKQQLIDAVEHVSFEMNRYLYTADPIPKLPGRYGEAVEESCLLHSRNIGEFFFEGGKNDDIRISHYYDELISVNELKDEIEKSKPQWAEYKKRLNKKLGHLTFKRVGSTPMSIQEKNELNFDVLIKLFENNLPIEFREKWKRGEGFSTPR